MVSSALSKHFLNQNDITRFNIFCCNDTSTFFSIYKSNINCTKIITYKFPLFLICKCWIKCKFNLKNKYQTIIAKYFFLIAINFSITCYIVCKPRMNKNKISLTFLLSTSKIPIDSLKQQRICVCISMNCFCMLSDSIFSSTILFNTFNACK